MSCAVPSVSRFGDRLAGVFGCVCVGLAFGAGCAQTRHVVALGDVEQAVVITDVTVLDGTGAAPLQHQDVVIAGGVVFSIGPTGAEHNARPIDGRGHTLLPGFTDAHVHIAGDGAPHGAGHGFTVEENLERMVRVGITTAFDMGGAATDVRGYDARVLDGTLAGPRLFHTNLVITGKDSYPIGIADELMSAPAWLVRLLLPQVASEDDIAHVLDELEQAGVDYVKIMVDRMPEGEPIMPRPLLKALITSARARHLPVFVHAGHTDDATAACEAGATALAHLPWRGRFTNDQLSAIKRSGCAVVATASMWESTLAVLEGHFVPTAADSALVPPELRQRIGRTEPLFKGRPRSIPCETALLLRLTVR